MEEEENEVKERTSSKALLELEQESLHKLEQFIVITWQPLPQRERVKIWIDDGTFKMYLSNKKFIDILENILMDNQSEKTYRNMRNIELSLKEYQGFYQYNRQTDTFRELHQLHFNEKFSKNELYEESRKDYDKKFGKEKNDILKNNIFNIIAGKDIQFTSGINLENKPRFYGSGR